MDIATEIRKLPYGNVKVLAQILDDEDSWKNLMAIIPKNLERNKYECDVSKNNPCKYHSDYFKLLESSSMMMRKMCTELLFGEWGTSAKIRPTLGHLLYLLTKAQLYRAADYVAQTLLQKEPPQRPVQGHTAIVTVTIPDASTPEIERVLEAQEYHSSIAARCGGIAPGEDPGKPSPLPDSVIPHISAIMSSEPDQNLSSASDLSVLSALNMKTHSMLTENEVSSGSLPPISDQLEDGTTSKEMLDPILPDFSGLGIVQKSGFIPSVSLVVESLNTDVTPPVDINIIESENSSLPSFGASLSEKTIPTSESKNFLPITDHASDNSTCGSSKTSNASSNISHNSDSRSKCVSPLPNLSLNTPLPHFCYYEVESATNNFDETPHQNCRQVENPLTETNGRFLGSGAFGSVFLGFIDDKPVAVKKLFLQNMDVVDLDDPVTKRFKNEVEVLSKYKHENLVSLIGYSCDGPTYCFLYEFMPGGALKDRLQNTKEKFIWTDRLYIALGTARAVSYLHTAYSQPLVHRDIKTANILLDCRNKPMLCDFGLVKLIRNQNTSTNTTAFGTSAYMAREAFRGDVSVKLDTYSFGVVLLELVTGLPPFDECREGCDIVTHVEDVCVDNSIAPLIDWKAGSWIAKDINVAEELYKISTKCLEQRKRKRPTMVEVTKELAELLQQCS